MKALTNVESNLKYFLCFKCCRLNPWLDIEPLTCIYVSNRSKIGFELVTSRNGKMTNLHRYDVDTISRKPMVQYTTHPKFV